MNIPSLREQITAYLQNPKYAVRGWYCTWWIRHYIESGAVGTRAIRKELDKMLKDGLVVADHSQSNNTMWQMAPKEVAR